VRQAAAHCQRLELIGERVRAHFDSDLVPAPGQFLLARLTPAFDPYLRRPLFPTLIADSGFAADFDPADSALIAPGVWIDVIGPVGSAVPDIPSRARVLLIADSDPAVLLPLASQAIARGGAATLIISARYPLESLDPEIEVRVGGLPALTAEFAAAADLIFIHCHHSLHRPIHHSIIQSRGLAPRDYAFALSRSPMPCGVGACGACAVKTTRGWKLACVDGPFFYSTDID